MKYEFSGLFRQAWNMAMMPGSICTGFEKVVSIHLIHKPLKLMKKKTLILVRGTQLMM